MPGKHLSENESLLNTAIGFPYNKVCLVFYNIITPRSVITTLTPRFMLTFKRRLQLMMSIFHTTLRCDHFVNTTSKKLF